MKRLSNKKNTPSIGVNLLKWVDLELTPSAIISVTRSAEEGYQLYIRFKHLFAIQGYSLFVFCLLLLGIGISITLPYLSLYFTEEVGISAGAFGVFMAVSSLSGVVVNSLIAKRSDSGMDRKWLIISATFSSGLAYAAYLLFHNFFILLIVVSFFNGLGAATMPQIYAYAHESANASKSDDKTFAMSTLRSLFSLGFLIGPLVGTIILGAVSYKGLFLGTAVIYVLIASFVFLFLPRKAVQVRTGTSKSTNNSALKSRQIRLPLIAFIFLFMANSIHMINTPLFMVNELHGTHSDVGLTASVCAGLEIPLMLVLGALGKKISSHTLMIVCCFIAVIYNIILSVSTDPWQLIAAQLLQATFVAILMGIGLSYFTNLLPDSPGMATTLYTNGSTIGRLAGSLVSGILADFAGFRNVYWVCSVIVMLSFVVLWRTRSRPEMEVSYS